MSTMEQAELTAHEVVTPPVRQTKRYVVGAFHILFGVLLGLMLTVWKGSADSTGFGFGASTDWFTIPTAVGQRLDRSGAPGVPAHRHRGYRLMRPVEGRLDTVLTMVAVVIGIVALLLWVGTVEADTELDITGLLRDTLFLAVPLILGALAGVCQRAVGRDQPGHRGPDPRGRFRRRAGRPRSPEA